MDPEVALSAHGTHDSSLERSPPEMYTMPLQHVFGHACNIATLMEFFHLLSDHGFFRLKPPTAT